MDREQQLNSVADSISLHSLNFRTLFNGSEATAGGVARYKILHFAARAGPLPLSETGTRLSLSRASRTQCTDGFITKGLTDREIDERDLRVITILITRKGTHYLSDAQERYRMYMRNLTSSLGSGRSHGAFRHSSCGGQDIPANALMRAEEQVTNKER